MRDQLFIDDVNKQQRVDSDCEFVESVDEEVLKKLSDQYVEYLKLIKDNWSSCHASKILSLDLVRYIVPRFRQLSAPLRVRILTSFFYIKDNLVSHIRAYSIIYIGLLYVIITHIMR